MAPGRGAGGLTVATLVLEERRISHHFFYD